MKLRAVATRRPADDAEVAAAIAAIEHRPGIYFGTDRGVAGLHALGAVLVDAPALRFVVGASAVEVDALDEAGEALLSGDAMAPVHAAIAAGRSPIDALRAFLAAFEPCADIRLVGALPFDAHRLASTDAAADREPRGFLLFATRFLERDAAGTWRRVTLKMDGVVSTRHSERSEDSRPVVATRSFASLGMSRAGDDATPARDDFAPGGYADVVARAVERLRSTPLVSLTLSQSFRRELPPDASAARAFESLRAVNPAPATFFFHAGDGERVFGASPDLQLCIDADGNVDAFPVCGTVARGGGAVAEAEALRELFAHDVDAASLAVCSDALAADLAPLCEPGSLQLTDRRRPMSLATVVHAVDRLGGRLAAGRDAWDAIVATAAPPMLVGAPRTLALEAIASLEASPRRWYGGLVVEARGDGAARVGTLLRAATLRGGIAEVRTGGDLLADSDPAREEAESRHKALSSWRALGLAASEPTAVGSSTHDAMGRTDPPPERPAATVDLAAGDDPFAASIEGVLAALGHRRTHDAAVTVVAGPDASASLMRGGGIVAIGDAAYAWLRRSGVAIEPIAPENGRLRRAVAEPAIEALAPPARIFVGSYRRHRLVGADFAVDGWQAWLRDADDGAPLALARDDLAVVCLLYRPESTLSDPFARSLLAHAIATVATASRPGRNQPRESAQTLRAQPIA